MEGNLRYGPVEFGDNALEVLYIHPGEEYSPGEERALSIHGVKIGDVVIHTLDGQMCASDFNSPPDSINFGAYMSDVLANLGSFDRPIMVVWDTENMVWVEAHS